MSELIDEKLISRTHDEILKLLQRQPGLTGREYIILMGNLLYSVGASMAGFKGKAPFGEKLAQLYYQYPKNPGIAMMAQGELMTTWVESLQQAEPLPQQQPEEKK